LLVYFERTYEASPREFISWHLDDALMEEVRPRISKDVALTETGLSGIVNE